MPIPHFLHGLHGQHEGAQQTLSEDTLWEQQPKLVLKMSPEEKEEDARMVEQRHGKTRGRFAACSADAPPTGGFAGEQRSSTLQVTA